MLGYEKTVYANTTVFGKLVQFRNKIESMPNMIF